MQQSADHRELRRQARQALSAYGITPSRMTLLASRHNEVFRVDAGNAGRFVLRVQNGLLDDRQATSQLQWLAKLAAEADLTVPAPVATTSGETFVRLHLPAGVRRAVLLRWVPGRHAAPFDDAAYAAVAGMIARMHLHAERARPPRGFACRRLDADWLFGPRFFARSARADDRLDREQRRCAARVERFVRAAMDAAGTAPRRFGVIHADLNPANVIFHRGRPCPIDFDEFGRGWYLFDLAELFRTSITPQNWIARREFALAIYRRQRPLAAADAAHYDAFMVATFVQYLNWAFEHARNPHDLRWVEFCLAMMDLMVRQLPRGALVRLPC